MLASGIQIINGLAGAGTADSFLSPTDGTIQLSDGVGDMTLSTGALMQVEPTIPILIEALSIGSADDVFSIGLQTGPGTNAEFTTDFPGGTDIAFANPFAGLFTNGGDLTVTAGENVDIGAASAFEADVRVTSGTQVDGGTVSVSDLFGDLVRIQSDGPVSLDFVTAETTWISAQGDITDSENANLQVGDATFIAEAGGSISLGVATDSTFDADRLSFQGDAVTTINDTDDLALFQVSVTGETSITSGGDLTDVGDIDDSFLGFLGNTTTFNVTGNLTIADDNATDDIIFFGQLSAIATGDLSIHADSVENVVEFFLVDQLVGQDVTLTTTGNLLGNQTGTISVTGKTTLSADGDVTLGNSTAQFNDKMDISGVDVDLQAAGNLTFGDVDISGNLSTSITGDLSDSDVDVIGDGIDIAGQTSITAEGNILLDDLVNDFDSDQSGDSVTALGVDVTLSDANSISLADIDAVNLTVTAVSGSITDDGTTTGTGSDVNVLGSTSLTADADITLDDLFNNFSSQGPPSPDQSDGLTANGVSVTINDLDDIVLADISAEDLSVRSGGSVTDLTSSTISVTGETSILGSNIELDNNTNSYNGPVDLSALNITLVSDGDLLLDDIDASSDLTVTSDGNISDGESTGADADINVVGATSLSATGDIELDDITNDFDSDATGDLASDEVDVTGASVSLFDANSIALGSINASSLTVSAGGTVSDTESKAIVVTGETSIAASGDFDILLDNEDTHDFDANDTSAGISVEGNDITIQDRDHLVVGSVSATGSLTLRSGGEILQATGTNVRVAGATSLSAAGDITLDNIANDFDFDATGSAAVDEVDAFGAAIVLTDSDAIALGSITATDFSVTASGSITDSESKALVVSGTTTLIATGFDIVLDNADTHDFDSDDTGEGVIVDAEDVVLEDEDTITLGDLSVTGSLSVISGDAVAQVPDSDIVVAGPTSITAQGGIALDEINNDFDSDDSNDGFFAEGSDLTIADIDALRLGALSVTGDLNLASGRDITQVSGTNIEVAGITSLSAAGDITLDDINNDFDSDDSGDGIDAFGVNLTLDDEDTITLGDLSVTGSLSVVSGDAVAQVPDSDIVVAGPTSITAQGNIELDEINNDFAETSDFDAQSSADITLTDLDRISLGTISTGATGSLTVRSGGVTVPTGETLTSSRIEFESVANTDSGHEYSILGNLVSDNGTTLTGSLRDDLIEVIPQTGSAFVIDGGDEETSSPGDQLLVDFGAAGAVLNAGAADLVVPDGQFVFESPFQDIEFRDIETIPAGELRVEDILVTGTTWNTANGDALYSILGSDSRTLPWSNINQIHVTFNQDVNVTPDSVGLFGVNNAEYSLLADDPNDQVPANQDGFRYDAGTRTLVLTFAQNVPTDRLLFRVSGDATDVSPVSAAAGGELLGEDFLQSFRVLVGDVTGEASVSVTDVVNVSQRVQPGTFGTNYDPFADLDRNGSISVTDIVNASSRVGTTLPDGSPNPPDDSQSEDDGSTGGLLDTLGGSFFASANLGSSGETL